MALAHGYIDPVADEWRREGTYTASGVTVEVWKLVQSALRDSMGLRPSRVPLSMLLVYGIED